MLLDSNLKKIEFNDHEKKVSISNFKTEVLKCEKQTNEITKKQKMEK